LLVLFGLTSSLVEADFLGEKDDNYLGFQITASLDAKSGDLLPGKYRYSYLLIEQTDRVRAGIALTSDGDNSLTLNYLRPSTSFEIDTSRVADYAIPLMRLDDSGGSDDANAAVAVGATLVGLALVGVIVKHDLEKKWQPAN
jgi:hypothetical protein